MARYVSLRLVQTVFVVAAAMLVAIIALNVFTDPARLALPLNASASQVHDFKVHFDLTGGAGARIWRMWTNSLRGNFGQSVWLNQSAFGAAVGRLPATLELALPATIIGGGLGVVLGTAIARRPGTRLDRVVTTAANVGFSLPEFWVAILLVYVFAVRLGWLPTSGYSGPGGLKYYVLPVSVLSFRALAYTCLIMRASVLEQVQKPYVMTAITKGMSGRAVFRHHVRRNSIVPVLTVLFFQLATMLVGVTLIIEVIFNWPGIGRLSYNALEQGDVFLISACVFIGAAATALLNLITDALTLLIDSRARAELIQ